MGIFERCSARPGLLRIPRLLLSAALPTLLIPLLLPLASNAAADVAKDPRRPYSISEQREPCNSYDPWRRPFFGDLHVHTAFSQDASSQGTRNTPYDAYRFARGETLGLQPYDDSGRPLRSLKLSRPLDFAAVTDHAEMLGETHICLTPGLPGHDSLICKIFRYWPRAAFFLMNNRSSNSRSPTRYDFCGEDGANCLRAAGSMWEEIQKAAEGAYDRSAACSFSSFVAYEWTGSPASNNLHRNVIFRNKHTLRLPISYYEAVTPQSLWRQLATQCKGACEALTIPHNSNLSNGLMFQTVNPDGSEIDAGDAAERAANEPLVEITQHKGDSECIITGSAEDELCGFEKLPYSNFAGNYVSWLAEDPKPSSFLREALKQGLAQEQKLGVNPFKFGFVGSTDTHLGTPGAVEEDNYKGHGGAGAPADANQAPSLPDELELNPGGLAVLWAEENTRDSLFAAMKRREAYATSGTRPLLRVFGGWRFPDDMCKRPDFVELGYRLGVPMGADLPAQPAASLGPHSHEDSREGDQPQAPSFAVLALKDPGSEHAQGTPLQHLQIVKGWLADGKTHEKVYEIAGDPGNGAWVNPRSCQSGGPGFNELCTVWTDPDFDRQERAFYYVRVLENPVCRWSQHICVANHVDCDKLGEVPEGLQACCSEEHRKVIQERAWSSPLWYRPPRAHNS